MTFHYDSTKLNDHVVIDNVDDLNFVTHRLNFETSLLIGAVVNLAGESKLPYGQVPVMLYNGEITLQTSSGKVSTLVLDTHNFDEKLQDQTPDQVYNKTGSVSTKMNLARKSYYTCVAFALNEFYIIPTSFHSICIKLAVGHHCVVDIAFGNTIIRPSCS